MEIIKGIYNVDLGIWIKEHRVLVLSDFHIGFEESANRDGIMLPRFQLKDTIARLDVIFSEVKPETVVLNGDIKHEFGKISSQEWRDALKLIDFISKHCKRIVLVKGNHDKILGPIANKRNIEVAESFRIRNILILHGHKIPGCLDNDNAIKTIIIGHEHPAVTIHEGGRSEKFKCFIFGKYRRFNLIVQPSFNLVTEGTDMLKEKTLSPFLAQDISRFRVFVIADKTYDFGLLKNIL